MEVTHNHFRRATPLSIINILHICLDCQQLRSYCFCDRHFVPFMRTIKSELKGQHNTKLLLPSMTQLTRKWNYMNKFVNPTKK